MFLARIEPPAVLKPINFDEEGLEKFGVADVEDFTWKTVLDGYFRIECGRFLPHRAQQILQVSFLSPKEVMMKIRKEQRRNSLLWPAKTKQLWERLKLL